MAPKEIKGTDDVELVCPKCGFKEGADEEKNVTVETQESKEDIVMLDEKSTTLPETDNECEKCHNKKAYWWIEQTRSADEAPTRFYRCTKCRHTWREYG